MTQAPYQHEIEIDKMETAATYSDIIYYDTVTDRL